MKQTLSLKLGQQLTMTPQLQQAIRLLQLSTLDLQQEIQQTLESNPMLELDEEEPAPDGNEIEEPAGEPEEDVSADAAEDRDADESADDAAEDWEDAVSASADDLPDEDGTA
ncbi:MAG: RNA polymerase factor sigma-54, partial [Pseudomonadales bacterium]